MSFSSYYSQGGGLHVENLGFVVGGSIDGRLRPCPGAAYSMIHNRERLSEAMTETLEAMGN
jgi:hypothetical protein